jgi:hypothetical protein
MDEQTSKPRKDIFKYGCLAGLVLLLMIVLGGLFGLYYAKKMFKDFTDSKPAVLPEVRMSRAEIQKIQQRIDNFRQAVRMGKPTEPLKLTSDEINALIATDPDLSALKGKLFVKLSGNEVEGQLSVPMESVGLPLFRGRYLNGTGTFNIGLHNGQLRLHISSFEAKGRRVPKVYMDQIRKENLASGINQEPRAAAALDWLKEITVEDGKLVLVPKPKSQQ